MPAIGVFENGLLFVAFLLIVSGYLMRRSARRRVASPEMSPSPSRVDAAIKRIEACEARLNDYAREIDAAYQTRAAVLRELIAEADEATLRREADECEVEALAEPAILPLDERSQITRLLRQAGYSDEQVTKLLIRMDDHDGGASPSRRAA